MNNELKKIGSNYFYNLVFQIVSIIVPLITTPYISRVLGAEAIGVYSYTLSISTYFIVGGSLGFPLYGQREVAYKSNNKKERSSVFFQIVSGQFILLILSLLLYIGFVTFYVEENTNVFYAQTVGIIGSVFATSWFYIGIEEFKVTLYKNLIVKLLSVAGLFLFVKNPEDVLVYTIIMGGSNVVGNLIILFDLKNYVDFSYFKLSIKDIVKHIRPAFLLGIPYYITSIYAIVDKTMLGILSTGYSEVGYYEQTQKILTLVIAIVTSLGTVLMPRLANNYGANDRESLVSYLNNGINITSMLGFPIMFGLIVISSLLVPWFFGEGYEKVTVLIYIFSSLALIMGLNNLIGSQFLVAIKKEKVLTLVILASTVINCCFNFLLIPKYNAIGAACATVISEIVKLIILMAYISVVMNINVTKYWIRYLIPSLIMFIMTSVVKLNVLMYPTILNTVLLIALGVVSYIVSLIFIKDKYIMKFISSMSYLGGDNYESHK
ncbi:MAG: flippase [Erysipelotrichales bacterium]|nr:flippase [Erysipelotrichales bacterium]